jgi:uncharacterized protein (UPF0548 family)
LNVFNTPLTYAEVGATQYDELPDGYNHLRVATYIGGADRFGAAVDCVMTWRMHRAAGLLVTAERAHEGQDIVGRLGPFRVPCRVVWTLAGPDRAGFGYGTLRGHPERGEEAFVVELRADGVWLVVLAFSRPAVWFTRAAGPLVVVLQRLYAHHLGRRLRSLTGSGARS